MTVEPLPPAALPSAMVAARSAAWLARVAESGLTSLGLSLSQYRVLGLLSTGAWGASLVAEAMTVTRPSVTAVVDGLVARGLAERRSHPDDRRRMDLVLTGEGERLLAEADAVIAHRLDDLATYLDPEDAPRAKEGLSLWFKAKEVKMTRMLDAKRGMT